ncbi:MAG: amino acid ABC transporter permease [Proteobacteria bacterium]|nr:amino acid ABC transporter permease [Pseudomonadota bacterium]MBI3497674.1 amino acid ABC transporter permease [Pseudomonadota bacterium]
MSVLVDNLGALILALLLLNVKLTCIAILIALPIASTFAVARLSTNPLLYYPVTIYVNVLRSSPLLMILFWAYYTGPMLTGQASSAERAALIALTAFEVAYFTEIVRTGIQSIPMSQRRAGLATGLTSRLVTQLIILPQALRRMLPSLLTQSIIAFQDSTIASIIGVPDVAQVATILNAREQRPIQLYGGLAIMFFVICYALSHLVRGLERRTAKRITGIGAAA